MRYYLLILISFLFVSCDYFDEYSEDFYISIIQSDGSNYSKVTDDFTNQISISPNEEIIIGGRYDEIWIATVSGEILDVLQYDLNGTVSFTNDSQYAFFSSGSDSRSDIYKLNITDSSVEQVTSISDTYVTDPKYNSTLNLLLCRGLNPDKREDSIYIIDLETSVIDTLISEIYSNETIFRRVFWSQNKIIYYRQVEDFGIFSINFDGSENTKLVDSYIFGLTVAENSDVFVYEIYDLNISEYVLYKYDLSTDIVEELTYGSKADISSDGSIIAFDFPDYKLAICDLVTNEIEIIRSCDDIFEIDLSVSGNSIIFLEEIIDFP